MLCWDFLVAVVAALLSSSISRRVDLVRALSYSARLLHGHSMATAGLLELNVFCLM